MNPELIKLAAQTILEKKAGMEKQARMTSLEFLTKWMRGDFRQSGLHGRTARLFNTLSRTEPSYNVKNLGLTGLGDMSKRHVPRPGSVFTTIESDGKESVRTFLEARLRDIRKDLPQYKSFDDLYKREGMDLYSMLTNPKSIAARYKEFPGLYNQWHTETWPEKILEMLKRMTF